MTKTYNICGDPCEANFYYYTHTLIKQSDAEVYNTEEVYNYKSKSLDL